MLSFSKTFSFSLLLISFCASLAVEEAEKPHPAAKDLVSPLLKAKGDTAWSVWIANTLMKRYPEYASYDQANPKWDYDQALIEHAFWNLWLETKSEKYFDYAKKNLDYFLSPDGNLKTYMFTQFRLDDILHGRTLLDLYHLTGESKYKDAIDTLRKQLAEQPRNADGGFWHKEIYPNQMWLDGLYMAEPFYAEYAAIFKEPKDFDDIMVQFIIMSGHARDPKTGLMYHGWDSSRKQKWADPSTGCSPVFWGRAMGWYMMGLVDVLDYLPRDHPGRSKLISILRDLSSALEKYRDKNSGLWYQVVDKVGAEGNYLEASASAMFIYAFAKGARLGYLPHKYLDVSANAFQDLILHLVKLDSTGLPSITDICTGAGLGGIPYRDGSYNYYIGIPRSDNDFKGVGAFILASIELEKAGKLK